MKECTKIIIFITGPKTEIGARTKTPVEVFIEFEKKLILWDLKSVFFLSDQQNKWLNFSTKHFILNTVHHLILAEH